MKYIAPTYCQYRERKMTNFSIEKLNPLLGYQSHYRPQGFSMINEAAVTRQLLHPSKRTANGCSFDRQYTAIFL
jgi:hypothetical protein